MRAPPPEQLIEVAVCAVAALMAGLALYYYPEERGVASFYGGVTVFLGLLLLSGLDDKE